MMNDKLSRRFEDWLKTNDRSLYSMLMADGILSESVAQAGNALAKAYHRLIEEYQASELEAYRLVIEMLPEVAEELRNAYEEEE